MAQISPSILACDFARLGEDVKDVCERGIDYLHIDIMDGAFVPNISFGPAVMKSLNKVATVPYDVHLMIEKPDRYIEDFVTPNTEFITVHYEACDDLKATLDHIHSCGVKAGVSIKPGTPAEVLDPYLADIDLILVMSVEPGFGGQKFMDSCLPKIEHFKNVKSGQPSTTQNGSSGTTLDANARGFVIEVDGGVGSANAHLVKEAGVDIIVAGSAVFKAEDRSAEIAAIKE